MQIICNRFTDNSTRSSHTDHLYDTTDHQLLWTNYTQAKKVNCKKCKTFHIFVKQSRIMISESWWLICEITDSVYDHCCVYLGHFLAALPVDLAKSMPTASSYFKLSNNFMLSKVKSLPWGGVSSVACEPKLFHLYGILEKNANFCTLDPFFTTLKCSLSRVFHVVLHVWKQLHVG